MTAAANYLRVGDSGPALIFLHGIGGGKESWRRQIEHFGTHGYRAFAWDAPGYGGAPLPTDYTWPVLALALRDFLDRMQLPRAIVVGHSMGGMLAQEFAARHPERLQALVLSGTSPAFGRADGAWQQEFVQKRLGPLDAGKTMADLAPGLVAGLIGEAPDAAGVEAARACMSGVAPETYRRAVRNLLTFDRRAALAEIAVPTLLLAGEKDTTAPAAVMQRMAEKIKGASFHCLPGAGHLANFEQPDAYNAAIAAFLARLR